MNSIITDNDLCATDNDLCNTDNKVFSSHLYPIGNDLTSSGNELIAGESTNSAFFSEFSDLISNLNLLEQTTDYPTSYSFSYPQINFLNNLTSIKVPLNYNDALKSPQRAEWKKAMREELDSLRLKGVFELVPDEKQKLISTMWVYCLKTDLGEIKYKARLVARGDCQSSDQYSDTFAPTTEFAILRYVLTLALTLNLIPWNIDIKTAFLNAGLKEKIFIRVPAGFNCPAGLVIRLVRSLYGLKQAGRNWHLKITEILRSLDFVPLERVPTLFRHTKIPNLFICVYVDDCLLLAPSLLVKDKIVAKLSAKLDLHDRGPLRELLGVHFHFDNDLRFFTYNQRTLIESLLDRFEIQQNVKVTTPLAAHDVLLPTPNAKSCDGDLYASIIGSLLYIARISRPDILFPVIQLSQFRENPKVPHLRKTYRLMIYLANTLGYSMMIHPGGALEVYTDSSFNSNHDSRNFNGSVVRFGRSVIHWSSTKMKFVVLSTDEAEIVGCLNGLRQLLYFKYLNCDLLHPAQALHRPSLVSDNEDEVCEMCEVPVLLIDNQGSITFCEKGPSKRTNYLTSKYNYLVQQFRVGAYSPQYVRTTENPADIFTKNLPLSLLENHLLVFFDQSTL